MNHLITAGCSFTSHERVNIHRTEEEFLNDRKEYWYYPHWIQTIKPEYKVYNMGNPGNSNLLIARSAIYKSRQLLNLGINGENIKIIIQWSSFHRKSYFISTELYDTISFNPLITYANDFIDDKKFPGEKGFWITTGIPDMNQSSLAALNPQIFQFNQNYLKTLYNDEERFIEWLEYFDYLIMFCEQHNIKLKCFFMNNPFSPAYRYGLVPCNYKNKFDMIRGIFIEKKIHNTWDEDYGNMRRFPWAEHLYKQIDWNKYCWFFNEENIHRNGGVFEWTIRNQIPSTESKFNPLYQEYERYNTQEETEKNLISGNASPWGHVSSCNYKKFTENVILKWDMFND